MPDPLTPQDIETAGRLLHGEAWQAGLSRDLPAPKPTLKSWAKGGRTPRPAEIEQYRERLDELLAEREAAIRAHRRKLRGR